MNELCSKFSVIIPVYNSEKTLSELIGRIIKVFTENNFSYEILLIDDCSSDNSWNVLKEISETRNNLRLIRLTRNFGQINAILCGFKHSSGDYIITMDDDLQHPPEEILKLINRIMGGYNVVYGKYEPKHSNYIKNLLSRVFQKLLHRILLVPDSIFLSPFAIYKRSVIKNIIEIKTSFAFLYGLVMKTTAASTICDVEVLHHERRTGSSNYNLIKYFKFSLDLIINYSSWPLQFISGIGTIISFFSISFAFWILVQKLLDPTYGIIGWNSLMAAITFLGGMTLLSLGIIGEYLRRILVETSYGQQYVIDEMKI